MNQPPIAVLQAAVGVVTTPNNPIRMSVGAGHLLLLACGNVTTGLAVYDSMDNLWAPAAPQVLTSPGVGIAYAIAKAAGPLNIYASGIGAQATAYEVSGVDALDVSASAAGNSTTWSAGSLTTASANELLFAAVAATSPSGTSTWTFASATFGGTQYKVASAPFSGAITGACTSGPWAGMSAAFLFKSYGLPMRAKFRPLAM